MAYRVSDAAIGRTDLSRHRSSRAPARIGDRALTRTVILSSVALSCLALASAGVLMLGRAHDPGSLRSYTASNKALKIALVEPAAQAQMEPVTSVAVAAAAPSGPDVRVKTAAVHENIRAPAEQTVALKAVPLPRGKPRALMLAAVPLPRERVVAKAPELSAPVVVAAVEPKVIASTETPSPQPSPASGLLNSGKPEFSRGEGDSGASTSQQSEADAPSPREVELAAQTDTADTTTSETASETKLADAAPVPATFGPARPAMEPFQLTSYAPTRDVVFGNDITGAIGNPLRDVNEAKSSANADAGSSPSPRPSPRKRGEGEEAAAPLPAKLAAVMPAKPVLKKPRVLTVQEKLWGSPVRLASATPMDSVRESTNIAARGNIPTMPYDRQTAVYVITHKKVYLPDGSELEAHSGYGEYMDDPRFARLRMRGVTPPHVYDLKMREALFHGVEAIRMLPIGGSDEIFGRDGILAHTYLLGPRGQSHGCVSFKDYDTFLEAFKAGKINRIAVLAKLD